MSSGILICYYHFTQKLFKMSISLTSDMRVDCGVWYDGVAQIWTRSLTPIQNPFSSPLKKEKTVGCFNFVFNFIDLNPQSKSLFMLYDKYA